MIVTASGPRLDRIILQFGPGAAIHGRLRDRAWARHPFHAWLEF
jgi:hypothetical protein